MKKIIIVFLMVMVVGCVSDELQDIYPQSFISENLKIEEPIGLKLETIFVFDKVSINVKLPQDGTYRLKIRNISNELVSQERLTAKEGNNFLSIYTKNLSKSSYTVELTADDHTVLGRTVFVNQ